MRRWRIAAVLPSGLLAGLLSALLSVGCGGPPPPLRIGESIPSFTLATPDGAEVDSHELVGRPLVVNFWATWCLPCLEEIPLLSEIHGEGTATVIGIALDRDAVEAVRRFVSEQQLPYLVLLGDEELFRRWSGIAIPHTVVVDAAGVVTSIHRGVIEDRELRAALRRVGTP